MQQSIDALIDRERNLSEIGERAVNLRNASVDYAKKSKKLRI